jgi:hypothetical protein
MFIREKIEALPLKESLDESGFQELRTNFNLPSLGKLYTTFGRVSRIKKRFEYITGLKDKKDGSEETSA